MSMPLADKSFPALVCSLQTSTHDIAVVCRPAHMLVMRPAHVSLRLFASQHTCHCACLQLAGQHTCSAFVCRPAYMSLRLFAACRPAHMLGFCLQEKEKKENYVGREILIIYWFGFLSQLLTLDYCRTVARDVISEWLPEVTLRHQRAEITEWIDSEAFLKYSYPYY